MAACEWCWARAFTRAMTDPSKSQAEHYDDLLAEQGALGADADCPERRQELKRSPR